MQAIRKKNGGGRGPHPEMASGPGPDSNGD